MELFFSLVVILLAAKIGAEVCLRLGQPAVLGEILAGVVIGMVIHYAPANVGAMSHLASDELFKGLAELGAFCLLLAAGIELDARDMLRASRRSAAIAIAGMLVPFAAGCALGAIFLPPSDLRAAQVLFLGTALAITAVPVAIKVLMDLGKLDTPLGQTIVAAAVADDILSLLLLAVLTGMLASGEPPGLYNILLIGAQAALFVAIVTLLLRFNNRSVGRVLAKLELEESDFVVLLVCALALAVLAEALGLHAILGAFSAGLLFSRRSVSVSRYTAVKDQVDALAHGFLGPLFFVSIGLHLDLDALSTIPGFLALLIAVAFAGKIIGAGGAALMSGFSHREAASIGVSMSARGVVELIVASIAVDAGLFDGAVTSPIIDNLFSAVVITAIVTSVAVPPILKLSMRE